MREDEIASLPTETERRREVVLTTISALMPSLHDLSSQFCSRALVRVQDGMRREDMEIMHVSERQEVAWLHADVQAEGSSEEQA